MTRKSNVTAMAVKMQAAAETFDAPSSTDDVWPIASLQPQINGVTIQNDEYTGSVHKPGDEVIGKRFSASFTIYLRPPGGDDVPAADAWIPGRFLKAMKFTEVRTAAAIPAAAEAVSGGTATGVTLGAGATGTEDLYKSMALILSDNGATVKEQLTAIRSYAADKTVELVETLGTPPAAEYQIPKQLSFQRSIDESDAPFLSMSLWLGGLRYDLVDVAMSSARFVIPTSTRDQGAYPRLEVSIDARIHAYADEATPSIPSVGNIPFWKDGDFWVAHKAVGGSSLTIDLGLTTAAPPNPNFEDGSGSPEIVETRGSINMDRQAYLKAQFDTLAMAQAQTQHPVFAQWGYTSGKIIQLVVPDARFNYQSPTLGNEFITESGDMFIDVFDKSVSLNFPYFG